MQPGIQLAVYLAKDSQARAHRDADAWRRLHARPDCPPLPADPKTPSLVERLAFALPMARRFRFR
jgi:hypothetical protein